LNKPLSTCCFRPKAFSIFRLGCATDNNSSLTDGRAEFFV
jgi:hypothetical protein